MSKSETATVARAGVREQGLRAAAVEIAEILVKEGRKESPNQAKIDVLMDIFATIREDVVTINNILAQAKITPLSTPPAQDQPVSLLAYTEQLIKTRGLLYGASARVLADCDKSGKEAMREEIEKLREAVAAAVRTTWNK